MGNGVLSTPDREESGNEIAAMSEHIRQLSAFLDNYWARNQILRTAQYATAMISGLMENASPDIANKLLAVSSKFSGVRVVLRLMDDIPMLVYNLSSIKGGGGLSERTANIALSVTNQLYYPIEHIAWAADQGLLPLQSSRFWLLSNVLWGASLVVSLLQTLIALYRLVCRLRGVEYHTSDASRKGALSDDVTSRQAAAGALRVQLVQTLAGAVQILSDLMLAVHWMPRGFPGAGCLTNLWMGFFGLLSSLIGLHKMVLPSKA